MKSAGLHDRLRAATAALHDAVERRFERFDLGDTADYAQFLALHAAAILPLERALEDAGIGGQLPDWPERRRSQALLQDLLAFGVDAPRPAPVTCQPGGEALGIAYVLEGSRLGAAVLFAQLPAGAPSAFLGHGRGLRLWPGFLRRLAELPLHEVAAAEHGARRAFDLFLTAQAPQALLL